MKKVFGWNMVFSALAFFLSFSLLASIASAGPRICGAPSQGVNAVLPHPAGMPRRALRQLGVGSAAYSLCMRPFDALRDLAGPVALAFAALAAFMRWRMRGKYNIEGSVAHDFLYWMCCCWPCALAQETRTLAQVDDDGTWPEGKGAAPPEQQPLMSK